MTCHAIETIIMVVARASAAVAVPLDILVNIHGFGLVRQ